jgi:hypothetical protein
MEENSFMDSRGENKLAANLLCQSLSAKAALSDSGESCPDPEILAAYFDRSLDANETGHFEMHLSQCAICRELLVALHRADESARAHRAPESSSWAWIWNWRWLAPAAAALIIAGVWVARRPMSKSGTEHQPLVAMTQSQPAPAMPARDYPRDETAAANTAPLGQPEKQASREFSAADKLFPENRQSRAVQKHESVKDKESDLPLNSRNAIGGLADLKKQNEPHSPGSAQAGDRANGSGAMVAGALEPTQPRANPAPAPHPMAMAAGAPVESAQSAAVQSDANSIGPQAGTLETRSKQAPAAARVSTERLPATVQAQSKTLALQTVEQRSSMRIIKTPDPQVLWRIAEGGFVGRSTDGGTTWKGELPEVGGQLTAGFAPSADVCWVVGRNGAIFLTTNASDWKRIQPPIAADFTAVTAQDASSAIVTTADGRKLVTTDGGAHWNLAQ